VVASLSARKGIKALSRNGTTIESATAEIASAARCFFMLDFFNFILARSVVA
jgi:hypothetical protein